MSRNNIFQAVKPVMTISTIHTARKEHICSTCNKKIKLGERYWRVNNDEGITVMKEHTNCLSEDDVQQQEH